MKLLLTLFIFLCAAAMAQVWYVDSFSNSTPSEGGGGGITFNDLTQGTITSNGGTTASITPTADADVLVSVGFSITGDTLNGNEAITVSGCGISNWTLIDKQQHGGRRSTFVIKGSSASPSSGALTITMSTFTGTFEEILYSVDEIENANATPFGTAVKTSTASGTSLALPDVGTIDSGDYAFALFAMENAATITPDAGTTLTSIASGSGVRSIVVFYGDTDDTPSVTWASSASAGAIGFTVEKQ